MIMMHSANLKSVPSKVLYNLGVMLTFISGYEVLYVFGNVLVEMQFANVEGLDDCAVV